MPVLNTNSKQRNLLNQSSTNKTDRHDIAEILLKVALNTIIPNSNPKVENNQSQSLQYLFGKKNICNKYDR